MIDQDTGMVQTLAPVGMIQVGVESVIEPKGDGDEEEEVPP